MDQKSDTVIRGELLLISGAAIAAASPASRSRLIARIGSAIAMARKSKGHSLLALATASGLPKSTLADLELGKGDPSVSVIVRLERALDLAPGFLLRVAR